MLPLTALAPAAVGAVALLGRTFPAGDRAWARLTALLGLVAAIPLLFADGSWRSLAAARPDLFAMGGGVAAAWVCVLIAPGKPAWRTTVLTGIAATGAVLAALAEWSVPAVLFLGCSLLACVTDMLLSRARLAAAAVAAGGVVLGGGLVSGRQGSWVFPDGVGGLSVWVAIVGVVALGVGAYLAWTRSPASLAPILPILMLGLHMTGRLLDRPLPWAATTALVAGTAFALWLGARGREGLFGWAGSVALGAVLLAPEYGVAATLALLLALLARTARREGPSYGPLLGSAVAAFMPLTLGFVVIAALARRTFEGAVEAPDVLASAPWAAAGAVLLGSFVVGLWLALGAASSSVAVANPQRAAVPGAIAAASFLIGAFPRGAGGLDRAPLGAEGGVLVLHLAALGAGIAAAWFFYSREDATIEVVGESIEEPTVAVPVAPEPRSLHVLVLVILGFGALAAAWLTIEGLRAGFL